MKKPILLIIVALSLLAACQSNPTTSDIKDTASLTLITSGQMTTEELSCQWV